MFPESNLYYTYPARHFIPAGYDHAVDDLNIVHLFVRQANSCDALFFIVILFFCFFVFHVGCFRAVWFLTVYI